MFPSFGRPRKAGDDCRSVTNKYGMGVWAGPSCCHLFPPIYPGILRATCSGHCEQQEVAQGRCCGWICCSGSSPRQTCSALIDILIMWAQKLGPGLISMRILIPRNTPRESAALFLVTCSFCSSCCSVPVSVKWETCAAGSSAPRGNSAGRSQWRQGMSVAGELGRGPGRC